MDAYFALTGAVGTYQRQSDQKGTLSLMAGGIYSFRGSNGRYSYDAGSGKIKWLSGYLAADSNTSSFRRNVNTSRSTSPSTPPRATST